MEAPRRDPSGPVDSAEWLVDLCTSASLQIRREQSQSDPNAACHDDLDPEALASGVLDAFFALQDSLASLLVDPDAVRDVLGRCGELLRLTQGEVAEACRRRGGREVEGPAYGHRRIGSDGGNASCANGDSSSCGHGSPGRRPTSDSCNATESRTSQPPRQNSSNIDGNLSSNSGVSRPVAVPVTSNVSGSLVSQTSFRRSPLVGMKLNSFVIKLNVVSSVSLVKIPT